MASPPVTRAPSGGAVTVSRWLIQQTCSSGSPAKSSPPFDPQRRLPELRDVRPLDGTPQLLRHQLRAVTDAERRHAELEQARVDERRVLGIDGRRPPGEDQRRGLAPPDVARGDLVADELE